MSALVPLYGCCPAGVGTALVEGLTSFVSRLAMARSLSTTDLFEHVVFPRIATASHPPVSNVGQYLSRDAVGLDGMGPRAEAVVVAVQELTGIEGLAEHTLVPWARVLSGNNPGAILRGGKRWCPQCFEDWHRRGVPPWEPLIWRVAPVVRCPVHRRRLADLCPRCKRPQPAVTKVVPIGRCSWCGAYLHVEDGTAMGAVPKVDGSEEALREWWTSIAVARMLSVQREAMVRASPMGFVHLLVDAVHRLGSGSSKALAQRVGSSYATLHSWASQRTRPRLDYFLAVCMRLGEDPAAVALYPYGAAFGVPWRAWRYRAVPWPPLAASARHRRVRYGPDFWAGVGERVRASMAEDGRRSVTEIARSLGVSVPGLRNHFPAEVEALAERHARRRSEEREIRFAKQEQQLREAVDELASQRIYPSAKRVFAHAGLKRQLSNERLRAVWRDAQRRAGDPPY